MNNGTVPAPPPVGPPTLPNPGLISSLLSSGDAEHELANALIDLQLRLNSRGVAAATFLAVYGMPDVLEHALSYRRYMASDKGIVEALASVALKKFMKGLSIMLGNK